MNLDGTTLVSSLSGMDRSSPVIKQVEKKKVSETFGQCTFTFEDFPACGRRATSAVRRPGGNEHEHDLRCDKHRGLAVDGSPTEVVEDILVLVRST